MTTFDTIVAIIRQGRVPIVKDEDYRFSACLFEENDRIFCSQKCKNLGHIYDYNGNSYSKSDVNNNEDNRQLVRIDERSKNEYKVGDLVDVDVERMKEADGSGCRFGELEDGIGLKIEDIQIDEEGSRLKVEGWWMSTEFVLPHNPATTDKQKRLEEGIKNGFLEDGKIVK